jgi:outer membrane protein, heavy metal efflux system
LAAQWGAKEPRFIAVDAAFELAPAVPPAERMRELVSQNPEVARWATEMELRRAVMKLEKAKTIPDPTLNGGWKGEGHSAGWVAGVSIPLPVFDRNQGGIKEAQYGMAKAHEDRRAAEAQACRDLAEAYQLLATSHAQGLILKEQIMPEAQKAFDASTEGYQQGKFGYLEVLDAQRTLFDAKLQWVQTLADFYAATANVEGLIGQSLETIDAPEVQEKKP